MIFVQEIRCDWRLLVVWGWWSADLIILALSRGEWLIALRPHGEVFIDEAL